MLPMSMFEILDLPEASLRRLLPKASTRALTQLVSAYPRTVGKVFLALLENSVSTQTMDFIREQMLRNDTPTILQIREAERELGRIISAEHLAPAVHN
jgi:hypothetical protein